MKQKALLTALYALEGNSFAGPQWKPGTELPTSLVVLRSGVNQSNQGVFNVSAATAQVFSNFMRGKGRDRVTIDFEHNTLEGTPAYKESKEPRPVAGRGIPILTPNGVELTNIEWTSEGRKMAEHFGDISPAPWHDKDGTVLGIHSVALVRNGAIYDLSFCSADETNQNQEENEMKDLLAALSAAKLIPENGTEADVVVLIQGLTASAEASKSALAALTALTADQVKAIAVDVAKAEVTALTAEVTALKADGIKIQKDHLIELAKFEGKVVALTADTVASLTVDQLREQIALIKPTVPLDQRTLPVALGADGGKVGPSDVQAEIARACGLDPAKVDWK